jgi:hypothetical protein
VTVAEFWDMTPRETFLAMEAGAWRMQQEQTLAMSAAWHAAAFQRAKRMPSLSSVLNRLKPKKHMPIEKRREEFEELSRRLNPHGGKHRARNGPDPDPGDAG